MVNWKCFSHYTVLQTIPDCPSQEQTVVLVGLGYYNMYQRGNMVWPSGFIQMGTLLKSYLYRSQYRDIGCSFQGFRVKEQKEVEL